MSETESPVPQEVPVNKSHDQDDPRPADNKTKDNESVSVDVDVVPDNKDINSEDPEATYHIDPDVIEKLSFGVLEHCLPDLQKAKSSLEEILKNQNILIETVQQENGKFSECKAMEDLTEMMIKSRRYYAKLMNLKKEMAALNEKSFKLKKRAVKLQQQKQKEELMKAQQLEREQEKERMLTAKVAKKPDPRPAQIT